MKCDKKCDVDGICGKYKSKVDNLSLRCSGEWAKRKVEHFKFYTEMFATGMKNFWPDRYYIDLFSGPGKCITRDTLEEFDGSPLNAINIKDKFTHYYFADLKPLCINDLKIRTGEHSSLISYYGEDCNYAVKKIVQDIPAKSLSLAIVDPSSLQFKFSSYSVLAERKIDLIVNYPIVSIERAVSSAIKMDWKSPVMDAFHPGWREFFNNNTVWGNSKNKIIFNLLNDYIEKIKYLGYYSSELTDSVTLRNSRNATLYYLFAFSKDKKGIEFWNKAKNSIHKKMPQQKLL